jgi:AraC family transcriptional regulator, L-rhamnose operon transcriptional activator RhaR
MDNPAKSGLSQDDLRRYDLKLFSRREYFAQTGMPLYVSRWAAARRMAVHTHDFTELVLVLAGTAEHVTPDGRFPLTAGDVFVIAKGHRHGYDQVRGLVAVNCCFDFDQLGLGRFDLKQLPGYVALFALEPRMRRRHEFRGRLRLTSRQLDTVTPLVLQLERELQTKPPGYRCLGQGLFLQFIAFICRCYGKATRPESRLLNQLGRVVSHLEANYQRPVTVADLVRQANMSERNLLRAFHECLDTSPIAYLIRHRVLRGAELLAETDQRIGEVAAAVGFSDSGYFCRQFRRWMGTSPREYRRRAQATRPAADP